jgi:hypothetical protein
MATTPTTTTEFHVRSLTRMLTAIIELPKTIAAEIANMPRATFTRLLTTGNPGIQDISGLEISVIEVLFGTSSGIAVEAQLAERDLRLNEGGASIRARDTLAACVRADLDDALDALALGSLQVQILIYEAKAGSADSSERALAVASDDDIS